ncbi:hypothetical protein RAM80_00840 [Pseudomonas sp. App30]
MPTTPLAAREVYQVLRDVAMGERRLQRLDAVTFDVDDWVITLHCDGAVPEYCESCHGPDARAYRFDASKPYGSNPVELLSGWERAQLERLLSAT